MFRRIVFVAALAGLIAGLVASGLQALRLVPLIHQAEVFETAAGAAMPAAHDHTGHDHGGHDHGGHDHGAMAWEPSDGLERVGFTLERVCGQRNNRNPVMAAFFSTDRLC